MIKMSQLRRPLAGWLTLLAAPALLASGCGHACSAGGCINGLYIQFTGDFAADKTYDVVISLLTPTPETVPFMNCTVSTPPGGTRQFLCSSAWMHSMQGGGIQFPEYQGLKVIQIDISSQGSLLGSQVYTPSYSTREINGEGCGTCTSGTIIVDFPTQADAGPQYRG